MEFVKIFWKNKVKDADMPKISISGEIVSEILSHLCSDDSFKNPSKFDSGLNV